MPTTIQEGKKVPQHNIEEEIQVYRHHNNIAEE